jgi:hypothetical protein
VEEGVGLSTELVIGSDPDHLLFTGVAMFDGPQDLYWLDLAAGAPAAVQLNAPLDAAGDVAFGAELSPDETRVFFSARDVLDGSSTLRTVAVDAPGDEVVLDDQTDVMAIRVFELP